MRVIMPSSLNMIVPDDCHLCPQQCGARRAIGGIGRCGAGSTVRVGRIDLHYWEEPPVAGSGGAGAVFFSGCPLGCLYCQNHPISIANGGWEITVSQLTAAFLKLQQRGAATLDLVTGTPYVPEIVEAVRMAKSAGLSVPVVWNSSGYERVETLQLLKDTVDVYLPDFKYWSDEWAASCSRTYAYRRVAKAALKEMRRQQPNNIVSSAGVLESGVIVRHLMLPGGSGEAGNILNYLSRAYGTTLWLSLMRQYTPTPAVAEHPLLGRRVSESEYQKAANLATRLGFERLFLQADDSADARYIPAFGS